jgi:hypothetical protein
VILKFADYFVYELMKLSPETQVGESIHFFSDGYPDQFGGPENLKFGQKNMRAFFKRNKNTDMEALGVRLEENFDDWRNGHRQMDDVLVMGIKF